MDVNARFVARDLLIITTLRCMPITLTWFADILGIERGRSPRFLDKAWAARFASFAASVVDASAYELDWIVRISHVTDVSVTIAHTSTTD